MFYLTMPSLHGLHFSISSMSHFTFTIPIVVEYWLEREINGSDIRDRSDDTPYDEQTHNHGATFRYLLLFDNCSRFGTVHFV